MQFSFDLLSEEEQQRFRRKLRVLEARKPRQCEHIKSNGEFCGSPALRERNYCYFHLTQIGRKLRADRACRESEAGPTHSEPANESGTRSARLELPTLEDAASIQIALMQVIDAILNGRLDTKRGGLVLYALQTASSNLKQGVVFNALEASTVAGSYKAFEADYELGEDAPELRVAEEEVTEAAVEQPVAKRPQDLTSLIMGHGCAKKAATEAACGSSENEPALSGQPTPEEEEEEDEEMKFCDPAMRTCCMLFGPMAVRDAWMQGSPMEKEILSQRVGWRRQEEISAELRSGPEGSTGLEKREAA